MSCLPLPISCLDPRGRLVALLALLLAGAGAVAGCAGSAGAAMRSAVEVDPADVGRSMSVLAADSMEGRGTGTPGAARAARFIARELEAYGLEPAFEPAEGRDSAWLQRVPLARTAGGQGFSLLDDPSALDTLAPARRVDAVNVIGVIRGSDSELRDEAVILGAHFDHVGIGTAVGGDSIYNGADDDASGVVTVLEVARALAGGPPPRRTVIFLLTTGEEVGLLGTRWYIRSPVVPLAQTVADLQIEMVGRPDPEAGGSGRAWLTGYSRSTVGAALAAAGVPIIDDPRPAQRFFERSDNIAFACRGMPAHTLSSFGMHSDYHGPDDEADRIDVAHLTLVIEAATKAVRVLADGPRPEWVGDGNPAGNAAVCG